MQIIHMAIALIIAYIGLFLETQPLEASGVRPPANHLAYHEWYGFYPAVPIPRNMAVRSEESQSVTIVRRPVAVNETTLLYKTVDHGTREYIPDLAAMATIRANKSGTWSSVFGARRWHENDIVLIPAGISITYDRNDVAIKAIAVQGTLAFTDTKTTVLRAGTILVEKGGLFVARNPNATVRTDIILGGTRAPEDKGQFLNGLLAIGGDVQIEGASPSVRFDKVALQAGASTLPATHTGWHVGDELLFTDTQTADATHWSYNHYNQRLVRALPQQWEIRTIANSKDGAITLNAPLLFPHEGYVAHTSRNIVIRSKETNPAKTNSRAHVLFLGPTNVSIKNAVFKDLGRTTSLEADDTVFAPDGTVTHKGTNQRGRYALHLHHLHTPFLLEGNVITGSAFEQRQNDTILRGIMGSPRWGIVNHNSHGDIRANIVIGASGSGIVGEDGTETGTVANNLVVGTGGGTGGGDDGRFAPALGKDLGYGGFGYWFRGPFLSVNENVGAGYFKVAAFGYFLHPDFSKSTIAGTPGIPDAYRGKNINVNSQGIHSFDRNIADGIFGDSAFVIFYSSAPHTVTNNTFLNRNTKGRGLDIRYTKSFTIEGGSITGGGSGVALHSNKETVHIGLSNTTISGFKTERLQE